MPLYKDFSDETTYVKVWEYSEDEVLDISLLEDENRNKIVSYHPKKVSEILMVRRILKEILPSHKILYRENGEPYLFPNDFEVSISHSFPLAALAISKKKIGIDLEKKNPKIVRIRNKFILHENLFIDDNFETDYLTAIWCVKEALYKIHHSKHWSLKKHYDVEPFNLENLTEIRCRVYDENFSDEFSAKIKDLGDYYLAIVEE